MWDSTTLKGKKEEKQRTSGRAGGFWGSQLQWKQRDWYFTHSIPNQLSIHLWFWYCLLGLFSGKWIIFWVQAYFHTSMGVIKSLSDEACFHNTSSECTSSPCRHRQTQRLSHYPQLCTVQFHHCFFLCLDLDLYSMQHPCVSCASHSNWCTHVPIRITHAPDLHNSLVAPGTSSNELNWKAMAFSPLIATCRSSLGWWLSSVSHPLFVFCFVSLLAQQIINQS